jgi:hypothetical protein
MPRSVRRLASPRVKILGAVADLGRAVFDRVRVTVAPLRYGAGVKGKVIDSFAGGVTCVMSEIAAEGLDLSPALAKLVGHDEAELAALICHTHANRATNRAAAKAGKTLIDKTFSPAAVCAGLRSAIEDQALRNRVSMMAS